MLDSGFDGVDAWVQILSDTPDPERRERLRSIRDGLLERVKQKGPEWLREEIDAQREAIESLRERFRRAEEAVSRTGRKRVDNDSGWTADAAPSAVVEHRNKVRSAHRRARDRLAVMEAVRDKIATDGLPPEQGDYRRAKERTIKIGNALRDRIDQEGSAPDFHDQKEQFKEWAGSVIGRSGSTAYSALRDTGCWGKPKQGDSSGLEAILERTMEYAKKHD